MSYGCDSRGGLDYRPCRYGSSRIAFRGPRKLCLGAYVACLGGTETFGRFVPEPFAELLEEELGMDCVNFGVVNAGLDAFVNDPAVLGLAAGARGVVIEAMGAQNMSNRFYSVHPRRNDRFVKASPALMALYPEVDFSQFAFTRAMLRALLAVGADRFAQVVEELRTAWLARMGLILSQLPGEAVLLWCAEAAPPSEDDLTAGAMLENAVPFVTAEMIAALAPRLRAVVIYTPSGAARAARAEGLVHSAFDAAAAERSLGAAAHREIAARLGAALAPREAALAPA